jgi:release factor glutamine methyltransferase
MTESKTKTIVDTIKWTTLQLEGGFVLNPRGEAEMIASAITGMSKTDTYMYPCRNLTPKETAAIKTIVAERITGKPLQYIIGFQHFRHLELKCREGVLIPRPETELLVEYAVSKIDIENYENKAAGLIAIDLGCGTGAIGLSIAHERPDIFVYLLDNSQNALELTRDNARRNGLADRVRVVESDIFDGVTELDGVVDLIVSNPPYIKTGDLQTLQREVRHEPVSALDGGLDGLDYYRIIADQTPLFLKHKGVLLLEIGFDQREQVVGIIKDTGAFTDITVSQDYAGNDRIVFAARA